MSYDQKTITWEAFCLNCTDNESCLKNPSKGGNGFLIAKTHHKKTGHNTFVRMTAEYHYGKTLGKKDNKSVKLEVYQKLV